jgi:hypothetical protein
MSEAAYNILMSLHVSDVGAALAAIVLFAAKAAPTRFTATNHYLLSSCHFGQREKSSLTCSALRTRKEDSRCTRNDNSESVPSSMESPQ